MTYQQKFEELRNEFAKASDKCSKADKELSEVNGFGDLRLIDNFADAKREFQTVGNNYHNFIDYAEKNNAKPEDEYGL
jgi:hypothetical protein